MILKAVGPFQALCSQVAAKAFAKVTQSHQESLNHFRQAELELLRGIRSFAEEEIRFLNELISKRERTD